MQIASLFLPLCESASIDVARGCPHHRDSGCLIGASHLVERVLIVLIYSRSSASRLPRTSSLNDRKEVFRALCATAAAFEVGPLFDCKRHVVDVAVNL